MFLIFILMNYFFIFICRGITHVCDVFCFPSVEHSEAFELVQREAMACGKPVVCSRLHNGVNVVNLHQETGLAVPVRDPVALGDALMQLLRDDGLRSRLGEQAMSFPRNFVFQEVGINSTDW
jgi:glycosyltransferase involved in cell wall biosynthesis